MGWIKIRIELHRVPRKHMMKWILLCYWWSDFFKNIIFCQISMLMFRWSKAEYVWGLCEKCGMVQKIPELLNRQPEPTEILNSLFVDVLARPQLIWIFLFFLLADSYQYQLQSMWQKCWNTNQSLVHNLRFRERGPLKSWRPETMAEAIFSVLKEGLSLSQAARKYDIPYPTFVLYANRVHNMLGPSADGGSGKCSSRLQAKRRAACGQWSVIFEWVGIFGFADLRPKGRGRPQRILLGVWPDEHIRGVIRAVVFRDSHQIKDEPHIPYPRLHVSLCRVVWRF